MLVDEMLKHLIVLIAKKWLGTTPCLIQRSYESCLHYYLHLVLARWNFLLNIHVYDITHGPREIVNRRGSTFIYSEPASIMSFEIECFYGV